MFLAWNEIKQNKLRFSLIIGVLFLIAYLVMFLSGLANGLQDMNKSAIEKWDADAVVLTSESDKSLPQSDMKKSDFDTKQVEKAEPIGVLNSIASKDDDSSSVALFGIDSNGFIMPDVVEGKAFQKDNEVVAGSSLKDEGFKLGDTVKLSSSDEKLKITGFTDDAKFNAAPVLYGTMDTFLDVKYGPAAKENEDHLNGYVIRDAHLDDIKVKDDFELVDTQSFIEHLPGFKEQNLTLNMMIYFLFAISAFILAIFLYVLTIQKVSIFGVMKAEGISSKYLASSVINQTLILAISGVVLGFILTVVTDLFLPAAVPVSFSYLDMFMYAVVLVVVAVLGALFSVRTIVKIDPLEAIGG